MESTAPTLVPITHAMHAAALDQLWHEKPLGHSIWLKVIDTRSFVSRSDMSLDGTVPDDICPVRVVNTYWSRKPSGRWACFNPLEEETYPMEPYDPTLEALVAAMLESLDHDAEMTAGYVDQLRQLAYTLKHILDNPEGHEPTPEQEQIMRQALGHLDPKNGDAELDYLDVLRRCQVAVDRELFKWDSSLVQPPGWSGDIQVAIGGGDFEPHETIPAENWNRRLQQV